jgi:putative oxidoreductase
MEWAVTSEQRWLSWAAWMTAATAVLHLAIIVGGARWYRFFGAGEQMARLAERGSAYPTIVTLGITAILGVWALYGLSGAGVVPRMPLLTPVLWAIAGVFLVRGIAGVPVVLMASGPYAQELRARMGFMICTSAVCVVLGLAYALGAARLGGSIR